MNYYEEIEVLIRKNEINRKSRIYQDNSDTLSTYWNIGKLIVEAQGGEKRAKYGNGLIKEWADKLTKIYGSGYNVSNLKRFRNFYVIFQKGATVWHQMTWSHIKAILPLREENKRYYYTNLCISENLSVRELAQQINNNSYERLLNKSENIKLITDKTDDNYEIINHIKNPILIKLNKNDKILKEKDLQIKILAEIKNFFHELGQGYTFVGNEYKIRYGNKNYFIDILLFNYKLNCFVVVELKLRELRKEDKGQIEFYMDMIDNNFKEHFHNRTIGIIVSRYQDKFIATFINEDNIIPITYLLKY